MAMNMKKLKLWIWLSYLPQYFTIQSRNLELRIVILIFENMFPIEALIELDFDFDL